MTSVLYCEKVIKHILKFAQKKIILMKYYSKGTELLRYKVKQANQDKHQTKT